MSLGCKGNNDIYWLRGCWIIGWEDVFENDIWEKKRRGGYWVLEKLELEGMFIYINRKEVG